jgi:hypothetical protein
MTDFKTFFGYFHVLQVMEHTRDSFRTNSVKKMRLFKKVENFLFCQFLPILATFYEVKITF